VRVRILPIPGTVMRLATPSDLQLLRDHPLDSRDSHLQVTDEAHAREDRDLHLLVRKKRLTSGSSELLDILALHLSRVPGEDVLDAQDVEVLWDKMEPFPEEVSGRPLLFGIDVAGREDAEPQKVREPQGAPLIVYLLEPSYCLMADTLARWTR